MPVPKLPLPFDELDTRPSLSPKPRISDDIQQVLSLLSGYDGSQRRLLKVSPTGVLYVCSPPVKGIINVEGVGAGYNWQGDDISTSEVLIYANCKNVGDIWVNKGIAAAVDTGHVLECGDSVIWGLNNLRSLHLHIVNAGEKVIITYTI